MTHVRSHQSYTQARPATTEELEKLADELLPVIQDELAKLEHKLIRSVRNKHGKQITENVARQTVLHLFFASGGDIVEMNL